MIQGSINQLLQSAAIFGRLAPGYELKVEARQSRKQLDVLEKQLEEAGKSGIQPDVEGTAASNISKEILSLKKEVSGRLFKADPSRETFLQYLRARSEAGEPIMKFQADPADIAQEQAELKAQKSLSREQNRVSKGKRNFMDYLGKQTISGGGTVSELPLSMLKQIAAQYSKKERKALMDMEDKNK